MLGRILKKKIGITIRFNWKDGCLTANQRQYGLSSLDDCKLNNIRPCVPNIVKPHTTRLMIHCESTKNRKSCGTWMIYKLLNEDGQNLFSVSLPGKNDYPYDSAERYGEILAGGATGKPALPYSSILTCFLK